MIPAWLFEHNVRIFITFMTISKLYTFITYQTKLRSNIITDKSFLEILLIAVVVKNRRQWNSFGRVCIREYLARFQEDLLNQRNLT